MQPTEDIDEQRKAFLRSMLRQWKRNKEKRNEEPEPVQNEPAPKTGVFSREEYAQSNFWDNRYAEHKGYFDWYVEYPELKALFDGPMPVPKNCSILMVGCGNSKLSEQMYDAGYKSVLSIDISSVIVERMNSIALSKGKPDLCYQVIDATNMPFADQQFDVVIDKGTLDALACGQTNDLSSLLIKEMYRVSKKQVVIVSHSSSSARKVIFQNYNQVLLRQCIPLDKVTILETKLQLSAQSELINIIRSQLKDKPMSHILKDKDALVSCLQEFKLAQKSKVQLEVYQVKLPPLVDQSQPQDVDQQEETKAEWSSEPQANDQKPVESEPVEQQGVESEPVESQGVESEPVESEPVEQQNNIVYAPRRQTFCFVYSFYKD